MLTKIIFAGFGGQGVLMMGYSLAHAAMSDGYEVTYLPAYGAEVRGGTANCTVAVSDEEIASPIASEPDYLVVLNKPSLYTFQNRLAPAGMVILNSSVIDVRPSRKDIKVCEVPAAEIAMQLGSPRSQNIVIMGAFVKKVGLISSDTYLESLKTIMGEKKKALMEVNRKAFAAGYEIQLTVN
jgi:2-oxoglutarate ferredoxin oxidoreductase subunit gamma